MAQRIAVLGAGPMGLAVAYELAKNVYYPVVFEADDRVGGMTATFDFNGLEIERYYHFHCTSDSGFLQILDELELGGMMRWEKTKMGYWYNGMLQPWGNPIALLKFKGLSFISKVRYGIFAYLCTKRNNWAPLDNVNATSWIRRWVGKEAYEALWESLFDLKFYGYANNLSAAWIWSRIRRIGRSRYNLMHEKLGYLEGGSATLLQALRADIEKNGGRIFLNAPISKVVIENEQVTGVETSGTVEYFDKVISTVPLPYVSRLIPELPSEIIGKLNSVHNIAVVCVIVKLRRSLTGNFWLNINDPEMDIPGLVEYTNLRSLDKHIVYVPFYMPGDHPKYEDGDQVFLDKVRSYLKVINKNLNDDDFIELRASRYRFAQPICEPGFLSKLPPAKLPIKGLWVADTSYYYPEDRGISESIDFGRELARDVMS